MKKSATNFETVEKSARIYGEENVDEVRCNNATLMNQNSFVHDEGLSKCNPCTTFSAFFSCPQYLEVSEAGRTPFSGGTPLELLSIPWWCFQIIENAHVKLSQSKVENLFV